MCIMNRTPKICFQQTTMLTPEQFVAGLTDFGPGRSKLFANSGNAYLKVHYQGPSEADVTECSRGIRERLYYDWSDPNSVVLTTIDSNLWDVASGRTYTFERQPNGRTAIHLAVAREGKNFQGCVLGFMLRTIGRRILERAFEHLIRAIETRNGLGKFMMMGGIVPASGNLDIAIQPGEESCIVRLRGRLNIDSSPALRERLIAMLQAQPPQAVFVDFSEVSYVDSSGIATLIEALKIARESQKTLCLRGLQGRLLHLFEVTGMSTLFEKSGCANASTQLQVS